MVGARNHPKGRRPQQSVATMMKREGLPDGTCPLNSCRTWELLDGKLDEVMTEATTSATQQLKATLELRTNDAGMEPVTEADMSIVMGDWQRASSR